MQPRRSLFLLDVSQPGITSLLYRPELNSTIALDISLEARSDPLKGATMLDVIVLALGVAFFALSIGYAYACDRL